MCEKCRGESYKGVRALFNGDLQTKAGFEDRADWKILSPAVIVYTGESVLENAENPLYRGCEKAVNGLTVDEQLALTGLSKLLKRPAFGKP